MTIGLSATEWYWRYRVGAAVNALRERGEPMAPQDFLLPDIPDAENGLQAALGVLDRWPRVGTEQHLITDTEWYSHALYSPSEQRPPDPIADNADYLRRCEPALLALGAANAIATGRSDLIIEEPATRSSHRDMALGKLRALARLLEDAAPRAASDGDPALALRMAGRVWMLSRFTWFKPAHALHPLVGMSIEAVASGMLEAQLASITPHTAEKDLVCAALRDLLTATDTEDAVSTSLAHAFAFERMAALDELMLAVSRSDRSLFANDPFNGLSHTFARYAPDTLIRIQLLRECERAIRVATAIKNALPASHWSDSEKILATQLGPDHRRRYESDLSLSPHVQYLATLWHALMRPRFQAVARARLTRTAVALKLFELEQGRPARSLDELMPNYLPKLPIDPYDPERGPLRYRPNGVTPQFSTRYGPDEAQHRRIDRQPLAILYSVGSNQEDDGGYLLLNNDGTLADTSRLRAEFNDEGPTDHWFLLAPRPAAVPELESGSPESFGDPYGWPGDFGGY